MPARLGVDTFVTLAGLWGLIAPKHFDDMPTIRSSGFPPRNAPKYHSQTLGHLSVPISKGTKESRRDARVGCFTDAQVTRSRFSTGIELVDPANPWIATALLDLVFHFPEPVPGLRPRGDRKNEGKDIPAL